MQTIKNSKSNDHYKSLKVLNGKVVHVIELETNEVEEYEDTYHFLVVEKLKIFTLDKCVYQLYFSPFTNNRIKEVLISEYKNKFPNAILSTAINFYVEEYEEVDFAMKYCDFIFLQAGLELFEQTIYIGDEYDSGDEETNIFVGNNCIEPVIQYSLLKSPVLDLLVTTPKTKLIQLGYDILSTIYSDIGLDAEDASHYAMKRYFTEF